MERQRRHLRKLLKIAAKMALDELIQIVEGEINIKKKLWVRPWMARRPELGCSVQVLEEIRTEDPKEFRSIMRMTRENYGALLHLISPTIQRQDTFMRDAIPAKVKFDICLNYLTTGASFRSMQTHYRVSIAAISSIIPEVCDAIYEGLKQYIQVPNSEDAWRLIEQGFRMRWNFPNCYGAIDGKHFSVQAPPHSGSNYYNYKQFYSVILLALVDHNYCFTLIDVGSNGMASDAGVFNNSKMKTALERPILPEGGLIVGDDAFPLKRYLMKPYPRSQRLTYGQKIFNYRLSRARRIVENAFGILVSRFMVFRKPMCLEIGKVTSIIRAACALHNWMRSTSQNTYTPSSSLDFEDIDNHQIVPGNWRDENVNIQNIGTQGSNHHSEIAKAIRDNYQNYFLNEGAVPWQRNMIH